MSCLTTLDDLETSLGDGSHRQTHSGCEDQVVLKRWWKDVCKQKTRDKLHVEMDVRTTTDKDTMSVMARLMGAVEELTSPHHCIHT